ncbi:MAG: GtrA family protein [Patescibacteria group bacterium]|nr:GtrA family protein [Patescibacteria group bacterium]MDD4304324.1 GtrA family protein [Patescibacteria group bacterium]MDD4695587.1 GtrA family protein [Patescibacteria group bacterium]
MNINNLNKYKKLLFQIIKFGIIGLINASIDFSIYIILTRGFDIQKKYYLIANFISFLCANIISFILNKKFAFEDQSKNNNNIKYIKFFTITLVSLIIYQISLFIFINYIGIQNNDIYGKIVGVIIGAIWNFSMYKILIFKNIKDNK